MGEVKRQNREPILLSNCHHRAIRKAHVQIGMPSIKLDGPTEKRGREKRYLVFAIGECSKKCERCAPVGSRAQQLIDFYCDRHRHEQVSP